METTQNREASRTIKKLPVRMPWRGSPRSNERGLVVKSAPRHSTEIKNPDKDLLTSFLGWFSIGLGLAEILAPEAVARLIGVHERKHRRLLRLYGVREIAAGLGIIARPKPTYWMWNRVIGDTIDLASMGRAMGSRGTDESRLRVAMLAVAGITALDIATSVRLTSERSPAAGHDPGSFQEPEGEDGQQECEDGEDERTGEFAVHTELASGALGPFHPKPTNDDTYLLAA